MLVLERGCRLRLFEGTVRGWLLRPQVDVKVSVSMTQRRKGDDEGIDKENEASSTFMSDRDSMFGPGVAP